ncbi:type I restriction-modification system subunit M N-terminal domain-containing protein [Methanoculleus chikugoensis]|uniref:type I restriction-modification system subunit M N-terminal domain-containing protein n=1 Tax=Methanoculleus chikugoensis TaxID=118126 RepID=UPI001FB209C3|nr:type I restriction-modification system subunit M N-terminal domain-containing protein [Methanoculleus chikugoensis]
MSNPLQSIEQMSYLIFMKRLEDMDVVEQNRARARGGCRIRQSSRGGMRSAGGRAGSTTLPSRCWSTSGIRSFPSSNRSITARRRFFPGRCRTPSL